MCNRKSGTGALVSVAQAELDVPRAPRLGKRNDSYETEQFLTSFFPPSPLPLFLLSFPLFPSLSPSSSSSPSSVLDSKPGSATMIRRRYRYIRR